jgi:hypothetical protein
VSFQGPFVAFVPLKYTDPSGRAWWIPILLVIDYGLDAWEIIQAARVLLDEDASQLEKEKAMGIIALTVALEMIEFDEAILTPLPIDDVVRRALIKSGLADDIGRIIISEGIDALEMGLDALMRRAGRHMKEQESSTIKVSTLPTTQPFASSILSYITVCHWKCYSDILACSRRKS